MPTLTTNFVRGDRSTRERGTLTRPRQLFSERERSRCHTSTISGTLQTDKGKASPYSTAERRVLELISVLGSQPAGDVSHIPGGRLPLLSARPAVTPATLKRSATSFPAW